jgi:hypothetical protein
MSDSVTGWFTFRAPAGGKVFVELPKGEDGSHMVGFWADAKLLRTMEKAFGAMAEAVEKEPKRCARCGEVGGVGERAGPLFENVAGPMCSACVGPSLPHRRR